MKSSFGEFGVKKITSFLGDTTIDSILFLRSLQGEQFLIPKKRIRFPIDEKNLSIWD